MRGMKEEYTCKTCRQTFVARVADRKRGWARYCSKSCKAIKQARATGYYGPKSKNTYDDDHPFSCEALGQWI